MALFVKTIHRAEIGTGRRLPLFQAKVSAGFPSPAEDYIEKKLDLNEHLIRHPASTFFVKVEGCSMVNAGIHHGDILIVDRSLEPADRKIVIAVINNEMTVKRIKKQGDRLCLLPENEAFDPIEIDEDSEFQIWGVVTSVIHKL